MTNAELVRAGEKVARRLADAGNRALFAGGFVRDKVLGRTPQDIDIATSAKPEEVQRLFENAIPVGAEFGVIKVFESGHAFDVATFRTEGAYEDGRHPDHVEFAGEREDAERRDFTINGMFYDPLTGETIDHVGGMDDLERKLVRTVGDPLKRFDEDKLRMLRAIRFAASLQFEIESKTHEAIGAMANRIHDTSWERIGDEISRILVEGGARRGFELMKETGLLNEVLPEVHAMAGVPQPPDFHPEGDVFEHTMLTLEKMEAPSVGLALGVLLHDVGKPLTYRVAERVRFDNHDKVGASSAYKICRRLKRSRRLMEQVSYLVRHHMRFKDAKEMRESTLRRFFSEEHFLELLDLYRLDCLASHGKLDVWEFCRDKLAEYEHEPIRPEPLLGGNDLIQLGYQPGPEFGKILETVEDAQLEHRISTKAEAEKLVLQSFPKQSSS